MVAQDLVSKFDNIDYILVWNPENKKFILTKYNDSDISKNKTYYYLFNVDGIPRTTIISSDDAFHFENLYLNDEKLYMLDLSILHKKVEKTEFHLLDKVFDKDFGFGNVVGLYYVDDISNPYINIQVRFENYVYIVNYFGDGHRITANEENKHITLKRICAY